MQVLATVKSMTDGRKHYSIVRGADRVTYCTCPAWKFSPDGHKTCKHLRAFKNH